MNPICHNCLNKHIEEWKIEEITYYVCHNCGDTNRPVNMLDDEIPSHVRKLFSDEYEKFKWEG